MRWRDGVRLAAHALAWRVRARLTRRDREAELDEEIQAHLALLADEHRRRGLSEAEAQRAARRDFGGAEQVREACRDLRRAPILDTLAADLRYAWRTLRRQPGFTAAAVATFALGIGASTAIYTVIHEAVLAPLPFPNADGIVWVVNSWHGSLGGLMNVEYQAWERQSRSFSRTAVYATRQVTLAGAGSAERVSAGTVSARFFSILGVAPALGRDFQPGEDEVGRERVALLSDGLWRRRFGGDPGVVGRSLVLDGEDYRVAGVLPRGFRFLEHEQPALFVPYVLQSTRPNDALSINQVNVIGWLRPGATAAAAESELRSILERSRHEYPLSTLSYPDANRPLVRVVSARQWRSARIGTAPFVLAGAVAVLLLIACANVANLQLARFLDRRQELAVRAALGAGRVRLVQQLVTESLVLAALGGLFALALAHAILQLAGRLAPESLGYLHDVRLQPATLAFAALLVMLAGVLAGTLPALVGTPGGARHTLQQGTPRHTQGRAARLWAQGFTALTLALAVVLAGGLGTAGAQLPAADRRPPRLRAGRPADAAGRAADRCLRRPRGRAGHVGPPRLRARDPAGCRGCRPLRRRPSRFLQRLPGGDRGQGAQAGPAPLGLRGVSQRTLSAAARRSGPARSSLPRGRGPRDGRGGRHQRDGAPAVLRIGRRGRREVARSRSVAHGRGRDRGHSRRAPRPGRGPRCSSRSRRRRARS